MDEKKLYYYGIDNLNTTFQRSTRHNISAPSAASEDKLHGLLHPGLEIFLQWGTKFQPRF